MSIVAIIWRWGSRYHIEKLTAIHGLDYLLVRFGPGLEDTKGALFWLVAFLAARLLETFFGLWSGYRFARDLGSGALFSFRRQAQLDRIHRRLLPYILSGAALVFVSSSASLSVPSILDIPSTTSRFLFHMGTSGGGDAFFASLALVVPLAVCLGLVSMAIRSTIHRERSERIHDHTPARKASVGAFVLAWSIAGYMLGPPVISLLCQVGSFDRLHETWCRVDEQVVVSIAHSLLGGVGVGIGAALVAHCMVALDWASRRGLVILLLLPLAVPPVIACEALRVLWRGIGGAGDSVWVGVLSALALFLPMVGVALSWRASGKGREEVEGSSRMGVGLGVARQVAIGTCLGSVLAFRSLSFDLSMSADGGIQRRLYSSINYLPRADVAALCVVIILVAILSLVPLVVLFDRRCEAC